MDQSRRSYLLCFPDFPCKSFKLKEFGLLATSLVDSKRSAGRGERGGTLHVLRRSHPALRSHQNQWHPVRLPAPARTTLPFLSRTIAAPANHPENLAPPRPHSQPNQ